MAHPSEGEPFPLEVVGIGPVPVGDGRTVLGATMTYEGALAGLPAEMTAELRRGATRRTSSWWTGPTASPTEAITARFASEGVVRRVRATSTARRWRRTSCRSTRRAPSRLPTCSLGLMALLAGGVLVYGLSITMSRNARDLAVVRAARASPLACSAAPPCWASLVFVARRADRRHPDRARGRPGDLAGLRREPRCRPRPRRRPARRSWPSLASRPCVLAFLVGTAAARRQARTRPAALLRTE